jgi:hypothetical protein
MSNNLTELEILLLMKKEDEALIDILIKIRQIKNRMD